MLAGKHRRKRYRQIHLQIICKFLPQVFFLICFSEHSDSCAQWERLGGVRLLSLSQYWNIHGFKIRFVSSFNLVPMESPFDVQINLFNKETEDISFLSPWPSSPLPVCKGKMWRV